MDRAILKKLFNIGLYGFIVAHITMLTIYVLPHEPASNAVVGISDMYMSRLFHQEWDLFAPEPPKESLKLSCVVHDERENPVDTIYLAEADLRRHLSGISITATKQVYQNRKIASYLLHEKKTNAEAWEGDYPISFFQMHGFYYCKSSLGVDPYLDRRPITLVVEEDDEVVLTSQKLYLKYYEHID